MQATLLKLCSSTGGVEKVHAIVCVCIYACVRQCAAEAPRVCFIIHTHVWILFQPTDTCQRHTQHILMFCYTAPVSSVVLWARPKTMALKINLDKPLYVCVHLICICCSCKIPKLYRPSRLHTSRHTHAHKWALLLP